MNDSDKLQLRVAALTHVGLRRRHNEDCIAVGKRIRCEPMEEPWLSVQRLEPVCACLVADGMGGHPAGDVASLLAIESLTAGIDGASPSETEIVGLLRDANRSLFEEMARHPQWYGMGTTAAGLIVDADRIVAFNVGDSRVYRIMPDGVQQVSVDDSEAFGLAGFFSRSARVLSQCLGGFPDDAELAPHVWRAPAIAGDEYLVCSDGLYDMLSDEAIAACLDPDPVRSVRTLFQAAMAEGGSDNISIILARVETAGAEESGSQ